MIYDPCGHDSAQFDSEEPTCPLCSFAKKSTKKQNPLNDTFDTQLQRAGVRGYERERTVITGRRFRWDFTFEHLKLAVEVHGGTYQPPHERGKKPLGAHSNGVKQRKDFEKWSLAALHGWCIIHLDTKDVKEGVGVDRVLTYLEKHCGYQDGRPVEDQTVRE